MIAQGTDGKLPICQFKRLPPGDDSPLPQAEGSSGDAIRCPLANDDAGTRDAKVMATVTRIVPATLTRKAIGGR